MTHKSNHSTMPDTTCTHPANDSIEAVAFGFATDSERQLVLDHVRSCEICATSLDNARFAALVLPLSPSYPEIELPDRVWAGIEERIANSTISSVQESLTSPSTLAQQPMRLHWAVAAVLALLTLAGGILLGRAVFDTDEDTPEPTIAQVTVTDPDVHASGTVRYDADQGLLVLKMDDMPAPPEGYVYQVWMIDGETPVPVGTMDVGSGTFATVSNPSNFDTLAVTVESGPLGNALPTSDPIVVADLTQLGGD